MAEQAPEQDQDRLEAFIETVKGLKDADTNNPATSGAVRGNVIKTSLQD